MVGPLARYASIGAGAGVKYSQGGRPIVPTDEVLERLRDTTVVAEALAKLGLDVDAVKLVAELAPSHGVTALNLPFSVCVG